MKRKIITIENGIVTIPDSVGMSIAEVADLLDIYYQTAKRHIHSIEESGVIGGNHSMNCTVEGQKVYPDYYGLEMIIAVAFRVQSAKAKIFRRYIMRKAVRHDAAATLIIPLQNPMLN